MKSLKVNYIGIKNILGIKQLEYKPGKINSIDGANGVGKTSFLKAIQGVVGGGHDGTLLRKGKKEGEIVLVFDNGMKLTKKIGEEKSKVTLKDSDGRPIAKAASFLKDIIDTVGLNPIELLTADTKKRVDILLESMPMKLDQQVFHEKTGIDIRADAGKHPIAILADSRAMLFESRASVNRELKDKQTMVENMRETLPFDVEIQDYSAQLQKVEIDLDVARDEQSDTIAVAKDLTDQKIVELSASLQSGIDQIKKESEDRIQKLRDKYEEDAGDARKELEVDCAKIRIKSEPVINDLTGEVAKLKDLVANEAKILAAKGYIEEGEKQIEVLQEKSETYSEKLESLAEIKRDMLSNFPIDGLEVKDGEIFLDGVIFDQVNEARKIQFALDVAGLRQAELPLICVDGLECLDKKSFDLFCEHAKATEMQFFVTRVTNEDEMNLKTVG